MTNLIKSFLRISIGQMRPFLRCYIYPLALKNLLIIYRKFYNVQRSKGAIILPPADFGSLGDEAMVVATVETLISKGVKQIIILSYGGIPFSESPCLKALTQVKFTKSGYSLYSRYHKI